MCSKHPTPKCQEALRPCYPFCHFLSLVRTSPKLDSGCFRRQVAELETAVELQNMEIKALTKLLEEKSQQMAGLMTAAPRFAEAFYRRKA